MKILRNSLGQGTIAIALTVLLVAGAGVTIFMNKGNLLVSKAKDEQKSLIARQDFNRIFSLGSFLVANNFILCKREAWGEDGSIPEMNCIYNAISDLEPDSFALTDMDRTDDGELTFNVDMKALESDGAMQVTTAAKVSFKLVNTYENQLYEQMVGRLSEQEKKINLDHYMIIQKVVLTIKTGKGKASVEKGEKGATREVVSRMGIRRPVAIPKLRTISSTCASKCRSSNSENPYVECRGQQTMDENSETDVQVVITNMGPGVLYGLAYGKKTTYLPSNSTITPPAPEVNAQFNVMESMSSGFLMPDVPIPVADTAKCQMFVQVTRDPTQSGAISQHSQQAGFIEYSIGIDNIAANEGRGSYTDREVLESYYNPVERFFDEVVFSSAHAQAESVDDTQVGSNLEPFRVKLDDGTEFDGYTQSVYVPVVHSH